MPENFKSKNGATLAGHSDKWADANRRQNSHQAGQGSRGSRNQGTGAAGRANTVATDTVDTTKMSQEEKLRYFNSLGLMGSKPKEEPKAAPVQPKPEAPKTTNPVKELSDKLGKIFASKPQLIQGIVQKLQAVPKEQLKDKAQAVLDSMSGNVSSEPTEVFSTIMRALEDAPAASKEAPQARGDSQSGMTEKEFRERNSYLGDKFVDQIIRQVRQFEDVEKALYTVDMAIENVDDTNDDNAIRSSMSSTADDLGSMGFELKSNEQSDEPEEGSIDWIRKIHLFVFDQNKFQKPFESYDSFSELVKNTHDLRIFQDYLEKMPKSAKTKPLYDLAMHKLNDFDPEAGEDSKFINLADAVFSILKDGEDVQQSSGSESTEVKPEVQLSPGMKHLVDTNKEAFAQDNLGDALKVFQNKGHQEDLSDLLKWVAENMKKEGKSTKEINRDMNYYYNELKDNYFKFKMAQNAMVDNAEAFDPEYGSEFEHYMMSFDGGMENYDKQGMTDTEKEFVEVYKRLKS